ncbi:MAG TPA: ATP-binding cassette domain-containing protein [Planctomycetes bacterium]|nr:ATP-binding cassette domain-containing protein [Planctomycetota bacterium]
MKLPIKESTDLPDALITTQARVKLDMVGLLHAAHLLPGDLSGGMRKRAAVARAMALDPEILFFDEPTSGLDPIMAAELDNLVLKLNQVFRITMVVVTHDLASAFTIADRIAMLKDGRVLALGTREEIQASRNPEVQAFIRRSIEEAGEQGVDFTKYLVR